MALFPICPGASALSLPNARVVCSAFGREKFISNGYVATETG